MFSYRWPALFYCTSSNLTVSDASSSQRNSRAQRLTVATNEAQERTDERIMVRVAGERRPTGGGGFGAIVRVRTGIRGASVVAPGALIAPDQGVPRLSLHDERVS